VFAIARTLPRRRRQTPTLRKTADQPKRRDPTKPHKTQVATVHVAEEGLVMQWEDDAKTMQSSVTFFAQVGLQTKRLADADGGIDDDNPPPTPLTLQ